MKSAPHNGNGRRKPGGIAGLGRFESNPQPSLVAIDLGGESCRVSMLCWTDGQPDIQLVHRFPNAPIKERGALRWDLRHICDGIQEGLRACAALAPAKIAAIGVDGWSVDYVRLGAAGHPIANPFCYRDERAIASQRQVHARMSPERVYALTGIQVLPLNTLYQLYADGLQEIPKDRHWVNLPEFVLHYLGGKRISEYTNATHTQLLSVESQAWCREIFAAAGLDLRAAPRVVRPGTDVGRLKIRFARLPAFRDTRLIAPACHDTASAIAGISAQGDDWAFISSGTWSLVGCVLDSPCLGDDARRSNFSNQGGIGGKINFLKNVNGMWMLHQCMEQWQSQANAWTLHRLLKECAILPPPDFVLDVDDPDLLLPGNMPARINAQLARAGQPRILQAPALANLILHSLAARYAAIVRDLANITQRRFKRIHVVGGGSKNELLNRLTEKATGLRVVVGSAESATTGNFAIQLAALAGDYRRDIGVTATAVADWAGVLVSRTAAPTQVEPAFNR
jgi:rhamnulokinase